MSWKFPRVGPQENLRCACSAPVAQMDRALASGAKGRGFESLLARHLCVGRSLESYSLSTEGLSAWRLQCECSTLVVGPIPTVPILAT